MILSENWIKTYLSVELIFLLVPVLGYLYTYLLITLQDNKHVHEFDSLEELSHSIWTCPSSFQAKTLGDSTLTVNELQAKQRTCPIDGDRLKLIDQLRLDTWLNYHHVELGGTFKPVGCKSRQKVAIVVPYRDRSEHLETFTLYMHQFLPDQLVEYTIYVIEQHDTKPFNRARLLNIGVTEVKKLNPDICCFIFHDVDLIPIDQKNLYMCSYMPRHLSSSVSTLRYTILYPNLFGGVVAMSNRHFDTIGGFSNEFFGWGGEDDDMFQRVVAAGLNIERTYREHGIYTMLRHHKSKRNDSK